MEKATETSYFNNVRNDIIDFLPLKIKHVLDVGCGSGQTGSKIKELFSEAEVIGIELNPEAGKVAQTQIDKIIIGNLEELEFDFPDEYFDCIICADILEHLKDPWSTLNKVSRCLKSDGVLIVSLPNLRHIVPILKIIFDRFKYEKSGILDNTHLRFFTYYTMMDMFNSCNLRVIDHKTNKSRSWKFFILNIVSLGLMKNFFVFQHIFKLCKK